MRVGISVRSNIVNSKEVFVLYKRYIEYFKCHEIVLLLPNQSDEIMELCDCYIITGGDDINPKIYNQINYASNNIDNEMDELDFKIIDIAYRTNKKLLGICRGIQSVNVFFGGTLLQNFDGHMDVKHKIIKVNKTSICDFGIEFETNSFHHQIVDRLGEGLVCTYESIDGVVEAIEHANGKIVAVQYHPEIDVNECSKKIFDALLSGEK